MKINEIGHLGLPGPPGIHLASPGHPNWYSFRSLAASSMTKSMILLAVSVRKPKKSQIRLNDELISAFCTEFRDESNAP